MCLGVKVFFHQTHTEVQCIAEMSEIAVISDNNTFALFSLQPLFEIIGDCFGAPQFTEGAHTSAQNSCLWYHTLNWKKKMCSYHCLTKSYDCPQTLDINSSLCRWELKGASNTRLFEISGLALIWSITLCSRTMLSWTINNLKEYFKSNMLQEHKESGVML